MEYRVLGNTGIEVGEIGMGCEGMTEENCGMAGKFFDLAEEAGINYFDLYSPNPDLHKAIGKALQGRRDKFVIQGHLCSAWLDGEYKRTRDLEETKTAFENQMKNLAVDYLDIGMIHYCDALSDWQTILDNGILDYAKALKAEGRIKHIGLSSHNPQVAQAAVETGDIEVLMFSINPCYDLLPADEDVEQFWNLENYQKHNTNMDPERQALYETCQSRGVGITVMKAFGGGNLLDAELSPAGAALTVNQCISYCLTRPAVATVLAGAHTVEQLEACIAYESATEEEKDYTEAFANFPKISWEGHCMYCSHCGPCVVHIDIANVTKFLNLALAQKELPETVREHYAVLDHHASECIRCGVCETRCPFGVGIRKNMDKATAIFGY